MLYHYTHILTTLCYTCKIGFGVSVAMASELIVGGSVGASSSGTAGRVSLIDSTLGVSFPVLYM